MLKIILYDFTYRKFKIRQNEPSGVTDQDSGPLQRGGWSKDWRENERFQLMLLYFLTQTDSYMSGSLCDN